MKSRFFNLLLLVTIPLSSFAIDVPPRVNQGVIDLRGYNFEEKGEVKLEGTWNFYWKKLLTPKEVAKQKSKDYFEFPQVWNGQSSLYKELDGQGYATYVVQVLIDP